MVTRRDLPPAAQAVQAAHAAIEYAVAYPDHLSDTLALLAVEDEPALWQLEQRAKDGGYCVVAFREPDLSFAMTALALEPGGRRLVRRVPLALSLREGVRT